MLLKNLQSAVILQELTITSDSASSTTFHWILHLKHYLVTLLTPHSQLLLGLNISQVLVTTSTNSFWTSTSTELALLCKLPYVDQKRSTLTLFIVNSPYISITFYPLSTQQTSLAITMTYSLLPSCHAAFMVVIDLASWYSRPKEILTGVKSLRDPLYTLALVMLATAFPIINLILFIVALIFYSLLKTPPILSPSSKDLFMHKTLFMAHAGLYSSAKTALIPLMPGLTPNFFPSLTDPSAATLRELEEPLSTQLSVSLRQSSWLSVIGLPEHGRSTYMITIV